MNVIHIMKSGKFCSTVSKMYNEYFDKNHSVLYLNSSQQSCVDDSYKIAQFEFFVSEKKQGNLFTCLKICRILKRYDLIVLHSFRLSNVLLTMFFVSGLYRRCLWIEWGGDLYDWNPYLFKSVKQMLINKMRLYLANNFKGIVAIFPPDRKTIKEKFPNTKAKIYYAPYIGASRFDINEYDPEYSRLKETMANNEPVYIQIGHQSNPLLNHIRVLESLEHFKNENIRIILPLSYGDLQNRKTVADKAVELFEDKAIVLKDFMPFDDYSELLKRIDIAIYDTERQIGLGNIMHLLKTNTKLFLSEKGIMYPYFKEQGVPVEPCECLSEMPFEEFVSYVKPDKNYIDYINDIYDYDSQLELWKNIYSDLELNR